MTKTAAISKPIKNNKTQKSIRNFRLNDRVWLSAQQKASDLGMNMTFLVENLLKNFIQNPYLVIGEPEIMDLPSDVQKDVDRLADIAGDAINKRISKSK